MLPDAVDGPGGADLRHCVVRAASAETASGDPGD